MFGTIRRHSTWLWVIIAGLTIVSFVIYFNPDAGRRGPSTSADVVVLGQVVTLEDRYQARNEARLYFYLNNQRWPERDPERTRQMGFDADREGTMRLLRILLARKNKISISGEALADLYRRIFGNATPAQLVRGPLGEGGIDEAILSRFLRNELAIMQLNMAITVPGAVVTPGEAERFTRQQIQEYAVEAVFIQATNFLPQIVVTEANLTNYFSQQAAGYLTKEKMIVTAVPFPLVEHLAEADKEIAADTNLTARLDSEYTANMTNSIFKTTNGFMPREQGVALLKTMQRTNLALRASAMKANAFATEIFEKVKDSTNQSLAVAELTKLAAARGIKVRVTAPFERDEPAPELKLYGRANEAVVKLNRQEPVQFQPVVGEEGAYIVALKEIVDPRLPALNEIRTTVMRDYQRSQAQQLAVQNGRQLLIQITNTMATGKSFPDAAVAAKVKPVSIPAISRATEGLPEIAGLAPLNMFKNYALSTEVGRTSNFIPTEDGGFLLFVKSKLPIDEARLKSELNTTFARLRRERESDAYSAWFQKQLQDPELQRLLPDNLQERPPTRRGG